MVSTRRLIPLVMIVLTIGAARLSVQAADLRVTLPKRSALTTVQRLNREGVDAVRKQHYEKAETLFYKAYLFDPADPFTLYNLGYVSELQGQVERAQKFYGLATEQATDAVIDRSSAKQLSGKSMKDAFGVLKDVPMQVNRMNVEAIRLLSEGRAPEADLLLQQALALDAGNLFTLNNMGVAKEARGDFDDALTYYVAAANAQSPEPVIVTMNRAWRGKPVSKMAADSAKKLRTRIQNATSDQSRAALLSMRGVAATNRNDLSAAQQDFLEAYALDPGSAFSLNNLGYLAESDGDLETAQTYYAEARKAKNANLRVGLATRQSVEGMHLLAVASDNDQKVDHKISQENQARRLESAPIGLKHRDNTPVVEPAPSTEGTSPVALPPPSQPPVVQPRR